jgi:hypothetical protein
VVATMPEGTKPNGMELLIDLVDRGIVRIVDLVFIRKDPDGSVTVRTVGDGLPVESRRATRRRRLGQAFSSRPCTTIA